MDLTLVAQRAFAANFRRLLGAFHFVEQGIVVMSVACPLFSLVEFRQALLVTGCVVRFNVSRPEGRFSPRRQDRKGARMWQRWMAFSFCSSVTLKFQITDTTHRRTPC